MGISNINAGLGAPPPPKNQPPTPGENMYMRVGSFGYDSSGNRGTRDKGFAFLDREETAGTVAYLGEAKRGTDITQMLGQGRAVRPEWANYAQYQGLKIESKGGAEHMMDSATNLESWLKKANDMVSENPWGKGPDAAAAALEFERTFLANDERALREMTDLQRRQYGAVYEISDSQVDRYKDISQYMSDDTPEARAAQRDRRDNPREGKEFQFIAPTNDLNAIEQYKLLRYELRDIHTAKAVGSGLDPDYNPLGLVEQDRYMPGEFVQESAEFAQMRIADRGARQKGKGKLTKDTKSVQL